MLTSSSAVGDKFVNVNTFPFLSSLAAQEVVIFTTSGAASDDNSSSWTFRLRWVFTYRRCRPSHSESPGRTNACVLPVWRSARGRGSQGHVRSTYRNWSDRWSRVCVGGLSHRRTGKIIYQYPINRVFIRIVHFRVGSISNQCRSESLCYLGHRCTLSNLSRHSNWFEYREPVDFFFW